MQYYKIRNWERFQHYKKRNPPWIKLHIEILTSEDWSVLADASKLHAVACMMVASKTAGYVPNNPAYIKRVAYLDTEPDFGPLISCGFFKNMLADASEVEQALADARPETETETKSEEEKEGESPARNFVNLAKEEGTRMPEDFEPDLAVATSMGLNDAEAQREVEKFKAHYRAAVGRDALRANWQAAWQLWLHRIPEFKNGHDIAANSTPSKTKTVWITEEDKRFKAAAALLKEKTGKNAIAMGSSNFSGVGYNFPESCVG